MRRLQWQPQHDQLLAVSLGADLPRVREQVNTNDAQLWQFEDPFLLVVTRVEKLSTGQLELVIVAVEGKGGEGHFRTFDEAMKPQGFTTMRTHIAEPKLARKIMNLGFKPSKQRDQSGRTVYYRSLINGR